MNLKAQLSIDGASIITLPMRHDARDKAKNQFTIRRWLQCLYVDLDDNVRVSFIDDGQVIAELNLLPDQLNDKVVFTTNLDRGDRYFWSTLTKGYSGTWAITAGILFRRKHPPAPIIEIQGKLFAEEFKIWY
jgi:hypothetical protein